MITLTTLFILLFIYSVYKIRIDSGSWKDFDPSESNILVDFIFTISTAVIIVFLCAILIYLTQNNIIP